MTDYNDGNWHPHTPGPCPVHEKSRVDVMFRDGTAYNGLSAGAWKWREDNHTTIVAFRVVEPYVEPPKPREFWIGNHHFAGLPDISTTPKDGYIHVREVIE
jgi:hypothetical protein